MGHSSRKFSKRTPRRSGFLKRLLLWGFLFTLLSVASAGCILTYSYLQSQDELPAVPDLSQYRPKIPTQIYAADGQLIGEFYNERRVMLPFHRIPKTLIQAILASEDKDFFNHEGVDYTGLIRAVYKTIFTGHQQGASTITMQTAKSLLESKLVKASRTRSFTAKLRYKIAQIMLAQKLEKHLAKEEILQLYLTHNYFGHNAYGVQAAAENYFRKNIWELSIGEQAIIAGLLQSPSGYNPWLHPERAKERRRYVLRRMKESGYISEAEQNKALNEALHVYPVQDPFHDIAPYFTESVRRHVVEKYGEEALYEGGLQVETTLDIERQAAAERAAVQGLWELDKRQGFRGALTHIALQDEAAFLARYQQTQLKEEAPILKPGKRYLALVTEVEKERVKIRIGQKIHGQIPLAAMRWARTPDPKTYFEGRLQNDAHKVLSRGDVIYAMAATEAQIKSRPGAGTMMKGIVHDLPLFTLEQDPAAEVALLSADPHSGYVQAMMGGYSFERSELNRTLQSCRQPGSSFKPLVYATAFDLLDFTPATLLADIPIVEENGSGAGEWKPKNSHGGFTGDVTVRRAIQMSMNIPAIKTIERVGPDNVVKYAKRFGIRSELYPSPALALGASCVTMWDLATAYGVFDTLGVRPEYRMIRSVRDRDGQLLEENGFEEDPTLPLISHLAALQRAWYRPREWVLDSGTAFMITRQLVNAVQGGTGSYANKVGKSVGGKTGTTNDQYDAWFMGFSQDLVTGVWVGHDKNDRPLGPQEFGGRASLPIWTDYMIEALKGIDQLPHAAPPGIVSATFDPDTGLEAPKGVSDYFKKGLTPPTAEERPRESGEFYQADH